MPEGSVANNTPVSAPQTSPDVSPLAPKPSNKMPHGITQSVDASEGFKPDTSEKQTQEKKQAKKPDAPEKKERHQESGDSTDANTEGQTLGEETQEPWKKTKHKIKVNGKEQEVEYDDLVRRAQMNEAAEIRFNQAAEMAKEAAQIKRVLQNLQQNDYGRALLEGKDPEQIAVERLHKEYLRHQEMSQMSERERQYYEQLENTQQELLRYKTQAENFVKQQEAIRKQQLEAKFSQEIEQELLESFQARNRKATKPFAALASSLAFAHLQATGGKPDVKRAVSFADKLIADSVADEVSAWDVPTAVSRLPKTLLDGIREHFLEQTRSQPRKQTQSQQQQVAKPNKGPVGLDTLFDDLINKL